MLLRALSKPLLPLYKHVASTTSPGSLLQCLSILMLEEFSDLPLAQLCAIPSYLVIGYQEAEAGTSLPASPSRGVAESKIHAKCYNIKDLSAIVIPEGNNNKFSSN